MEGIREFVQRNREEMFNTLRQLCAIPAPSHFEQQRAQFCKVWLEGIGAEGVYIDEADNVILPINCDGSDAVTVFLAHTDTVFPDREPMPYSDDGEIIRCPGVGDDTASLTVLLYAAKYLVENGVFPKNGVLLVCNSGEEGLGNLKGTRQLFKDYAGRIKTLISFDSTFNKIAHRCVGSHRYEVEVLTEGGHSYGAFGNRNAIAELSGIINDIYALQVPQIENSKTTYNVGEISGGTSVNTIAQSARMLCEYRSDNEACLAIMEEKFQTIFQSARDRGLELRVTRVGERPCMGAVDTGKIARLTQLCRDIILQATGVEAQTASSSTDCNIPLSLGIPAISIGVYHGGKAHTREEWVEKNSLPKGLEVGIRVILDVTKDTE